MLPLTGVCSEIGFGETERPLVLPPFTTRLMVIDWEDPSEPVTVTKPVYAPVARAAMFPVGEMVRMLGKLPLAGTTVNQLFAGDVVALKVIAPEELFTFTPACAGKLPPLE